jgi:hypothetical protein
MHILFCNLSGWNFYRLKIFCRIPSWILKNALGPLCMLKAILIWGTFVSRDHANVALGCLLQFVVSCCLTVNHALISRYSIELGVYWLNFGVIPFIRLDQLPIIGTFCCSAGCNGVSPWLPGFTPLPAASALLMSPGGGRCFQCHPAAWLWTTSSRCGQFLVMWIWNWMPL